LPKLKCEQSWGREFERLKASTKSVVANDSFAKALATIENLAMICLNIQIPQSEFVAPYRIHN
jgi:hypothetical protein